LEGDRISLHLWGDIILEHLHPHRGYLTFPRSILYNRLFTTITDHPRVSD